MNVSEDGENEMRYRQESVSYSHRSLPDPTKSILLPFFSHFFFLLFLLRVCLVVRDRQSTAAFNVQSAHVPLLFRLVDLPLVDFFLSFLCIIRPLHTFLFFSFFFRKALPNNSLCGFFPGQGSRASFVVLAVLSRGRCWLVPRAMITSLLHQHNFLFSASFHKLELQNYVTSKKEKT